MVTLKQQRAQRELLKKMIFKAYYPVKGMSMSQTKQRIELITLALGYSSVRTTAVIACNLGFSRKTPKWSQKEIGELLLGGFPKGRGKATCNSMRSRLRRKLGLK